MKKLQLRQFNNLFQVYDAGEEKVIAIFDSEQAARNFIINEIEDQNLILNSPMPPMGASSFMAPPPTMPWQGGMPPGMAMPPFAQGCQSHQINQCQSCHPNNFHQNDANSLNVISGMGNMMNTMISGFGSMMTTMGNLANNSNHNNNNNDRYNNVAPPRYEDRGPTLDTAQLLQRLEERDRLRESYEKLEQARQPQPRHYEDEPQYRPRDNRDFEREQEEIRRQMELDNLKYQRELKERYEELYRKPVQEEIKPQPVIEPESAIEKEAVKVLEPVKKEEPTIEETQKLDSTEEILEDLIEVTQETVDTKQNLVEKDDLFILEKEISGAKLRNKTLNDTTSHVNDDIYKLSDTQNTDTLDFNDFTSSFNFDISELKNNGGAFIKKRGKKGKISNIDDKSLGETSAYEGLEILNTPSKKVIADEQLVKVDYTKTFENADFGRNMRKAFREPVIIEPTVELDNTMDNLNGALAFELQRNLNKNAALDNNETVEVTSMLVDDNLDATNLDGKSLLDLGPETASMELEDDKTIDKKKEEKQKLSKIDAQILKTEKKLNKKEAAQEKKDEKRRKKLEDKWK
ncbi:hypothetical protein [Spiroplasma endosymbiont of Panorpa germanica]|uniref:hypothetical protein n=1 Tax=Spiroplasma endosymbiont of Panorpa germanica TaxID=3066314 RepID=UPI0030D4F1E5